MKNYGLDLEKELREQSVKDHIHVVGVSRVCDANIPEFQRELYLPEGEIQRSSIEDMMDCATRGPINILEAKFSFLLADDKFPQETQEWLEKNGYFQGGQVKFSDAFIAIKSGTSRRGNSLKAPLEAIREFGLIPKKLLPLGIDMTWEEYHNPTRIAPEMNNLGKEFLKRFTINYEKVYQTDYQKIDDFIDVAGYAWSEPINGVYPAIDFPPNHAFVRFKRPAHFIFDNYIDSSDGDFIKKLAQDYDLLDYGYRLYVTVHTVPQKQSNKVLTFWRKLLSIITGDYFRTFGSLRSSQWNKVRNDFLKKNPQCAVCGKKTNLVIHHKLPFHLYPNLELAENNLVTLCESAGLHCHITFGHLGSFQSYNKSVEIDTETWKIKLKLRP